MKLYGDKSGPYCPQSGYRARRIVDMCFLNENHRVNHTPGSDDIITSENIFGHGFRCPFVNYTNIRFGYELFVRSVEMAKEGGGALKFDPNTEAFQMRAQWKKQDMCRKQWFKRWSWLLDERIQAQAEAEAAKRQVAAALPHVVSRDEVVKTLKPVPVTTTGTIGWLASKPDCQLEIYTSWLSKIPLRLPDAWDDKGYLGTVETKDH